MSSNATERDNHELVLAVFTAVERRDTQRFTELVHPDFEIHWPRSLPYGGSYRDLDADAQQGRPTWAATWNPLQPTAPERHMDPRPDRLAPELEVVVGASPAMTRWGLW